MHSSINCWENVLFNLLVKLHSYTDCCWSGHTGSENGAGNFSLSATMNLTARSDTGTINSSPVSGSIPIIRQPSNCPRVITFPWEDPDGDTVRCQQVKMVETPGGGNPSFLHVFDQVRKCTLFDGFACNTGQNFTSRWLKNAINE